MSSGKWMISVWAGVCLVLSGAAVAADSVKISPKHVVGEKCYVEFETHVVQKMSSAQMPGGGMTAKVDRIYGLIQEVDAAADKTMLTMTFDRILQKIDAGAAMNGYYDSDDPENEETTSPLASALSPMLGMPIQLTIGPNQHVTSATGMVELRNHVSKMAGSNVFLRVIGPELDDVRARVAYGESRYALFANKEVKVGETWTSKVEDTVPMVGKVAIHYECKLDKIGTDNGRKAAFVSFEGTLKNADPPAGADSTDNPMTVSGKFKGTGIYDIEQGIFTRTESEGTRTITPNEEGSGGGMIPGKVELTVESSVIVTPEADRLKAKKELEKKADKAKKAAAERKAARKKARDTEKEASAKKDNGDSPDDDEGDDDDEEDADE